MRSPLTLLMAAGLTLALTVGARTLVAQGGENKAFEYHSFDVPDAVSTSPQGINARGDIVGVYVRSGVSHGFLWREGTVTTIDYPGAAYTDARGINAQGDIVGAYRMPGEPGVNLHGYLLSRHGEFSRLDFPGHTNTIPQRITATGVVLGCRHDNDLMMTMRGITMDAKGVNEAGEIEAFASMNNGATPDGRLIVGLYIDEDLNRGRGYLLYNGTTFIPFDVPGSASTAAWDVNANGAVVGVYTAQSVAHGFVWSGPSFESIDFPGARATRAFGINSQGTVVGNHTDAANRIHGFIAVRRP